MKSAPQAVHWSIYRLGRFQKRWAHCANILFLYTWWALYTLKAHSPVSTLLGIHIQRWLLQQMELEMSLESNRGRAYKEWLLPAHSVTYNWGPNISAPKNTAYYLHFFKIDVLWWGRATLGRMRWILKAWICFTCQRVHIISYEQNPNDVCSHLSTLDVLFLQTACWRAGEKILLSNLHNVKPWK